MASKAATTDKTGTTGATAGATSPAPDATDAALRAHVQAQDTAMGARLDAAESSLRETMSALDVGLRAHAQEAVAVTQLTVQELNEKMHLITTARGRSSDAPSMPPGLVPAEAHTVLEVVTRAN